MKRLTCVILAVMMLISMFAVNVAALEPTADSTKLYVTKYEIRQMNNEVDRIGNTNELTGTQKDAEGLDDYAKLEGVEFSIFKLGGMDMNVTDTEITAIDDSYNNGTIKFNGNTITASDRKTTGEDGVAVFEVAKANYGLYFVKETASPAHVTAKAQSFVVKLPRTSVDGKSFLQNTYVYPKNYTTLGAGILRKIDSSKNVGLAGAKFALYDEKGNMVTKDFYGANIGDSENLLTTDKDGYIFVNNLTVGKYYFQEVKAPTGYIIRKDQHKFEVKAGHSSEVEYKDGKYVYDTNKVKLLTADNSSQPQIDKFVTTIGNKEENVSYDEKAKWIIISDVPSDMGSKYTDYTITDTMDEELVFEEGSVSVYTTTTPSSGDLENAEFTLKTTGYTVSEVSKNSDGKYEFTVNFTDTASLENIKTIKVEFNTTLNRGKDADGNFITAMDHNIYNDVKLYYATNDANGNAKLREEDRPYVYTDGYVFKKTNIEGVELENAIFKVVDEAGNVVENHEGIESDINGFFEVRGLEYGTYYLVETQAPEGYELLTSRFKFVVSEGSHARTSANPEVIENVPLPDIPLTGGIGTTIFTVTGLALILSGVVLFVVSRKTKKSN